MARVRVRTGREGPHHDPYGFTEVTFTRTDGRVAVIHNGLGVWLKIDGERVEGPEESLEAAFEAFTGMTSRAAEAVPHILEDRYVRSLSPEDQAYYWAMKDADDCLLSYAM